MQDDSKSRYPGIPQSIGPDVRPLCHSNGSFLAGIVGYVAQIPCAAPRTIPGRRSGTEVLVVGALWHRAYRCAITLGAFVRVTTTLSRTKLSISSIRSEIIEGGLCVKLAVSGVCLAAVALVTRFVKGTRRSQTGPTGRATAHNNDRRRR